jgi:hypothetical protein
MDLKTTIKASLAALGFVAGLGFSSASAATVNYFPCLDVQNQGWGGLTCTVAPGDFALPPPPTNDSETNVEIVLNYVFGVPVDITAVAYGIAGDQPGFDFTPDSFGGTATTISVALSQSYDLMTFKVGDVWGIADIRGLTNFSFTTDDLIENQNGQPQAFSHVSFWVVEEIPEPVSLGLLGAGLVGLGLLRRRKP